jgi:hypothetical protein
MIDGQRCVVSVILRACITDAQYTESEMISELPTGNREHVLTELAAKSEFPVGTSLYSEDGLDLQQ